MSDQLEHSDSKNARILELYKFHSLQATEVSNRRATTNRFFILLLSGIAVVYTTLFQIDDKTQLLPFITTGNLKYLPLTFGIIGLTLSWVWLISIESNLRYNTRKYKVLKHMERHLDYEYFINEWALLGINKINKTYRSLALIEIVTPLIFIIIFTILYLFSLSHLSLPTNAMYLFFPQYMPLFQPDKSHYLLPIILTGIAILPWFFYIQNIYCYYQKSGSVTKDSVKAFL